MNRKILLLAALASLPLSAIAQVPQDDTRAKELSVGGPTSPGAPSVGRTARDGCANVENVPHNSADCSRIPRNDYNTIWNEPSTDLAGKPTGASENAERNARIIAGLARN